MELVWLEDFNALADSGNFSRAAELRHVTQPAFSRRIRALETWVGVDLFERTTQGAALTEAGKHMLTSAQEMTRRLYQMRLDAREVAGKQVRTLHFAATHSLSFTFFPGWIRGIERGAPIEALRLLSDSMMVCEQMLLHGEVQFLLCHQHPDVPPRFAADQFHSKAVGGDVLTPLRAADFLAEGDSAPLQHLAYTAESGLGRIVGARLQGEHSPPALNTVFSSHLAAVLLSMALEGKGIAWLPRSLAEQEVSSGKLVRALDERWDIPVEIRLFRPNAALSDFAEDFWARL
ncbi:MULTISPECIES: LysR family transcriptional regulator [unclassified Pseudomonas]|uniref:LysR family transcriptional regulator n=1 Tax=unclassified Pseudomonas TaxID=196821 RepID=UPI002AC8A195|nr:MULTISPECIES: LysR family transcriptional regulator [unclassified Pseudomonas]MEB0041319.1 LysR family transcriptional regulator [Pseudomonas sp. MH10]MEB0121392.1 LysR family transcriptional regulator [Pseudomonas sp. CCI1.2]WPX64704.1 LysR family transcriptional regulator [Pseudomonas sp. MH10]